MAHGGPVSGIYGVLAGGERVVHELAQIPTVLALATAGDDAWAATEDVTGLRIEPGGRLVEEQQLRLVDERAGDRDASLHAARQWLDPTLRPLGELHEVEQFGRALLAVARGMSK